MIILIFEMIGSFFMIFGAVGALGFYGGVFAFGLSLLLCMVVEATRPRSSC